MEDLTRYLKLAGYLIVMLAVVPLAGFCVTGSWRQAWRYARDWGRVMLILMGTGSILYLIVSQVIL